MIESAITNFTRVLFSTKPFLGFFFKTLKVGVLAECDILLHM